MAALARRIGQWRLAVVLAGGAAVYGAFTAATDVAGVGVLVLVVVLFLWLGARHNKVAESLRAAREFLAIKRELQARATLDWEAIPASRRPMSEDHPFGADLNVVGARSLHQLLDATTAEGGSERLRMWLLDARPDPDAIRQRHGAITALADLPRFRERLLLTARLAHGATAWSDAHLLRWMKGAPRSFTRMLIVLCLLAATNAALFIGYVLGLLPAYWSLTFLVYVSIYQFRHRDVGHLFNDAFDLERSLDVLKPVFEYLEAVPTGASREVGELLDPFRGSEAPSRLLRRVARIAAAASVQGNGLVRLLVNAPVPWDFLWMHRLEQCKAEVREKLPAWLDRWYEVEALSAMASFWYLNPSYVLPSFTETHPTTAVFEAKELGHPLIPHDHRVNNDIRVGSPGEVVLLTGSNMSGKSTFLRTMGLAVCLANAGGPVPAASLVLRPMRLFSSIKVSDSVHDGISFFYAEVRRLRKLLDALEAKDEHPLFFLIDELFKGTNNVERLTGGKALIRSLVGRNGIGAISTHDLDFVRLTEETPLLHNYHFREEVQGGRMQFDYRLHAGPCPTTNALKIMRMAGLPIDPVA